MPLLKALLVGLHELQFLRKAKPNSFTRVALSGQQQQKLLWRFLNVLKNSFETTDRLQPERLKMSSQYKRNCEQHWHFCIFKTVCSMGSTKPGRLSQKYAKSSDLLSCYKASGEGFSSRIVTEDGTWHHQFEKLTKRQSVEQYHPTLLLRRSWRPLMQRDKSWPLFLLERGEA